MQFRFTPYQRPLRTPFKTAAGEFSVRQGIILELRVDATGICYRSEASPLPGFSSESFEHVLERLHQDHQNIRQFFQAVGSSNGVGNPSLLDPTTGLGSAQTVHSAHGRMSNYGGPSNQGGPSAQENAESHSEPIETPNVSAFLQSYSSLPSLAFALSALLWQMDAHSHDPPNAGKSSQAGAAESAIPSTRHQKKTDPEALIHVNAVAGMLSPDALLQHLTRKYKQGFRVFKCKVGLHPHGLANTLHTFARTHKDVLFRLDANRSWALEDVETYSSLFSGLPVQYIEEPVAIDRPEQLEKVFARCKLPVALDESIQSPDQLERFACSDAARNVAAWIIKPTLFGNLFALRERLERYHLGERTVFTSSFETGVGRALIGWLAVHYGSAKFAHGLDTGDLFAEESEKLPGGPLLRYSDCINIIRPPDFRWQNRDLFFLSRTGIYTWNDLNMFRSAFWQWLEAEKIDLDRPFLVSAPASDEVVLLMAACYQFRIAMLIIPPETPWNTIRERIDNLPERIRPQAGFIEPNGGEEALDHDFALFKKTMPGVTAMVTRSDLHSFVSSATDVPNWVPSVQASHQNTLACIMFTSGSAGNPKAIPILRSQIESAAHAAAAFMKPDPGCMSHLMLPLYHIGGASVLFRSLIYETPILLQLAGSMQGECRGVRRTSDLAETARILQHNPLIQITSMVPTQLMRLLRDHELQVHPSMKTILLGGGPVNRDLMDLIGQTRRVVRRDVEGAAVRDVEREAARDIGREAVLPVRFSFGMTETAAMILSGTLMEQSEEGPWLQVHPPNEAEVRPWLLQTEPGSESHQPENNTEKGIRRGTGSGEGSDELDEGPLWVRGPQVVSAMDEDENVDPEAWFCTGDIATRMGDRFRIEMKREDRIVTGGKNVDPREVENRLREIGWIRDAVVIGVPDPEWGQKVIAFIVADRDGRKERSGEQKSGLMGSQEYGQLKADLGELLESYKFPKHCILVDAIPRTALQKVKRAELKILWESLYVDTK